MAFPSRFFSPSPGRFVNAFPRSTLMRWAAWQNKCRWRRSPSVSEHSRPSDSLGSRISRPKSWSFLAHFETDSIINIFTSSNGQLFSRFGAWSSRRFICCAPIAAPFSAALPNPRSQSPIFVPLFVFPSRCSWLCQFCSGFFLKLLCKESHRPSVITSPRRNDFSALPRSCSACSRRDHALGRIFRFPTRPPLSRLRGLMRLGDNFSGDLLCRASVVDRVGSVLEFLYGRRNLPFF